MSLLQNLQDAFGFGDRRFDHPSVDQFYQYPLDDASCSSQKQAYFSQDYDSVGTRATPSQPPRESGSTHNLSANLHNLSAAAEIVLMKLRSFAEAPEAIATLREQRSVILDLSLMDADQAQRCVDYVAGGVFAMDGQQHRLATSVFLFTPSFVQVSGYPASASNLSPSDEAEMYSSSHFSIKEQPPRAEPEGVLTPRSTLQSPNPFGNLPIQAEPF
jgi:cell division inhibitor SepF